jgi:hypothetical protein
MKKYAICAAAAFLAATSPSYCATLNLSIEYIGSTTSPTQTGLTIENLTEAQYQTTAWHHYFEVYVAFAPAAGTQQAFRFLINDNLFSGFTPTTRNGTNDLTSNKWFPVNPTDANSGVSVFSGSGDAGHAAGDLKAIFTDQTTDDSAQASQYGTANFAEGGAPSPLGEFTVEFTSPLAPGATATITTQEAAGLNFSFFNSNDGNNLNVTTMIGGVTSGTWSITEPGIGNLFQIPEPASLALLATGSLFLLRRRRR